MSNLIDKVGELKELEAKVPGEYRLNELGSIGEPTDSIISESDGIFDEILKVECWAHQNQGQYQTRRDTSNLLISLRNAAPALLEILGEIQAGDAQEFLWMLEFFSVNPERYAKNTEVLRRYQAMAAKMEARE